MANTQQPAYQAYTVIKREGQDDKQSNAPANNGKRGQDTGRNRGR